MKSDLLLAVTASARRAAEERARHNAADVLAEATSRRPRGPEFRNGLSRTGVSVIAECKRRSPSKGILRDPYDPVSIAIDYERAGAAAISVLTESTFFDGNLDHLTAVRSKVGTPLLRKDFVSTSFQVIEARAAGADAVLLIVGALDRATLRSLLAEARQQGLAALVEVHTRQELFEALDVEADIIGVNSRNLRTLDVDLRVFDDVIQQIPDEVVAVAESGIREAEDIRRLHASGYDAFLIGERFMTMADPGAALAALLAAAGEGGSL